MTPESYDPVFVDSVVDFVRTYADRTHHGKEEDILFAALAGKRLDTADARLMAELIDDHRQARLKVAEIVALNARFRRGEVGTALAIKELLAWLAGFYPAHIVKEDRHFFPGTERYFGAGELEALLARFEDFDRKMIHEKYQGLYESLMP